MNYLNRNRRIRPLKGQLIIQIISHPPLNFSQKSDRLLWLPNQTLLNLQKYVVLKIITHTKFITVINSVINAQRVELQVKNVWNANTVYVISVKDFNIKIYVSILIGDFMTNINFVFFVVNREQVGKSVNNALLEYA